MNGPGSVRLFHAARRTGRRTLALHGRLYVDVSFGDFPYAIRFTPATCAGTASMIRLDGYDALPPGK